MTVQGLGWAGIKNGELLRRAAGQVAAFLTMDRKLEHQHDLGACPFGVVVVRARALTPYRSDNPRIRLSRKPPWTRI